MLTAIPAAPLLLLGTAAGVGHESSHVTRLRRSWTTLANFDHLPVAAHALRPALSARFGLHTRLKMYVRDLEQLAEVAALLDSRLYPAVPRCAAHGRVPP